MSEFITPNGKTVSSYIDPQTVTFRIKFNQGGELPAELSGMFTSKVFADRAILAYIQKQDKPKDKASKES
jgi:hypothetical protein